MRNYASLQALIQELENDAGEIERLRSRNETAWERIRQGANDPVDWGALGFTIQTLYGVLENYFLRISKYFENNLPGDRWHMGLVEKMRLDIPNVRPAFLETDEQLGEVRQILRFRHRLRHLYGEDLDPAKTREIQKVVESFFQTFPALHQRFIARLRSIADAL
ncbi:MAG: hypothetical protein GVY14_04265 [Spirochaetes bacterium]|jgi:hypothetical protein|nr:hypothetical protein [Spirochaetota bacterium]